jgi:oxygen-independent coproporphyrinogen-3 oxidase
MSGIPAHAASVPTHRPDAIRPDAIRVETIPLALYVHFPWCVRKCPYCDFNSHPLRGDVPEGDYVAALLRDLDYELRERDARSLTSIFFGGGTPSLFSGRALGALLDAFAARFSFAADIEVTLEANPGTAEIRHFRDYRAAGINRLSLGIQSLDDAQLQRLGRIHGSSEARAAVRLARDAGFDNINLDLMYALPQQTPPQAEADLRAALALAPEHLSYYQLTLEPNTAFAAQPPPLPDDDDAWTMQLAGQALLADHGYGQYEVSAYARPGRQCRHNRNYWEFGDYLGIGAGAHGKLTDARTVRRRWKTRSPVAYLQNARTPQRVGGDETVTAGQLPFEFMLNALRLNDGVAMDVFRTRTGLPPAAIDAPLREARANGWLVDDPLRLEPTPLGRRFLNDLIEVFLPPGKPEHRHA